VRILLTGGNGFVASHVIAQLRSSRPDVIVRALDLHAGNDPQVEWHVGSILDETVLDTAVRGCDVVVHMAAMLGVRKTEQQRLACLQLNINGTTNLLDACVRESVSRITLLSSSEVYGDQTIVPIAETNPVQPKSVYAVTKLAGEEYLRAYQERYGLEYAIVRFFNVYGEGQVAEFVVSRFCKSIMEGRRPQVYGDGSQVRAFCHASDAARGVALASLSPAGALQTVNIGNDSQPITMESLARIVAKVGGTEIEPEFVPFSESDRTSDREVVERIPTIDRARKILGYEPQVSLEDGLRRIFDHGVVPASWHSTISE